MIMWITGLSGSGKSTLAAEVANFARGAGHPVLLVDGDVLREVWGDRLGFTVEARRANMARMARLCRYLDGQGVSAVAAVIAPFQETRDWNRANFSFYYEVFIDTPMDSLIARDGKGLYKKALSGIEEMPGINQPYERPLNPDLTIDNSGSVENLMNYAPMLANLLIA